MKKIGIIIFVIGVFLIVGGGVYIFFSEDTDSSPTPLVVKENRKYKTVLTDISDGGLSQSVSVDDFSSVVKNIGFKNAKCDNGDVSLCTATNKGYSNSDLEDSITLTYENNVVASLDMILYFYEKDFSVEKSTNISNTIMRNFFGYSITDTQIEELQSNLFNSEDKSYPVSVSTYEFNNYSIQLTLQYSSEQKLYTFHFLVYPLV